MKFLTIALATLSIPALANAADRLIYPNQPIAQESRSMETSLQKISDQLGLGLNAAEFRPLGLKRSFLGDHYYYQQYRNGQIINGAEVVVTLRNNRVFKIYNNAVKVVANKSAATVPMISSERALELAWQHLQVNGELLDSPVVALEYNRDLQLVYRINLSTSSPYGHNTIIVDAVSGNIVSQEDAALPRMKRAEVAPKRNKGPLVSLQSAINKFAAKSNKNLLDASMAITATGTAQIFDPNPVVTLGRTDLSDDMPGSVFTQAYRTEELKDISMVGSSYELRGPKVTLIDFESPNAAPSKSADGHWIFERKNLGFNDAMTYVHIDKSVRYIESLGFTGQRAVFPKSLEVDANGVNGDDNSHYIPSSRRLAFGHGCVDDNEDTDVILHELGHAIQHHINPQWFGGDTGAMGEGFGDYWAASYSVTTQGGMNTQPNWVFKWDGHNGCWPGRKLNAFTPTYDAAKSYGAHSQVNGGISDELWSTPIFQAFLEMMSKGAKRTDIDRIILEAHFGLGSGIKMPEMAKAIVKTAEALYPGQDFSKVYLKHFQKQKMLP